ncbi:MAG: tRNA1(Val) (adenine(37)-N6)-methyltransferase [Firmicutes bacterium]|nr:tRNA1(Val) (adenine(37)-N6)-methyltransferase [Bacillota bacterium]
MKTFFIYPNERIDDLQIPLENGAFVRIIQNPKYFCFGIDAVLLANFAHVPKAATVADLGCGCGVIPLIIAAKTNAKHIVGLEIQAEIAQMAQRSVKLNNLEEKITIENVDLREYKNKSIFDVVTCNPPYKEQGGGLKSRNIYHAIARHEILCTLNDVIKTAAQLLKPNGRLNMIHRPERLADIICSMRENKIEPKRLRFVHPKPSKTATSLLIEGIKGGAPKVFLEPPLYVYNENGEYSNEIKVIYNK